MAFDVESTGLGIRLEYSWPAVFAIESSITQAYESPRQRAMGYFVIELA